MNDVYGVLALLWFIAKLALIAFLIAFVVSGFSRRVVGRDRGADARPSERE